MIPLKLSVQGLYSYKEEQTIDFEKLTAAGIFGIFGAVGSGKSSILEAILLALYGSTERLSDRGEKNSMVNLQSQQLLINFEFKAGKNNSQIYLARYAVKRNSKRFDEIRPAEHTFYLKEGDVTTPLNQNAEAIIGMKKEHFKQTVIIPQGKFREFIDLTPGPRAEMMKELFGLARFDLSAKTGSLLKVVRGELIRLETQLEGLGDISAELLKEKEKAQQELAKTVNAATESLEKTNLQFQSLQTQKQKHNQLLAYQKQWEGLQSRTKEIETKKKELKAFIQANSYLKPVWNQIRDEQLELEKASVGFADCNRFKETYIEQIAKLEQQEGELRKKVDKRPEREAKIRDLEKVIAIQIIQRKLDAAQKKVSQIKPAIEEGLGQQKALENQLELLEKELEESRNQPNSTLMARLTGDLKDWKSLSLSIKKLEEAIAKLKLENDSIQKEENKILGMIPSQFTSLELWDAWEKENIKSIEADKAKYIEKKALQAHIHSLKEGEPCPLCGAVEHPSPLTSDHTEEKVNGYNQQIEETRQNLEKIQLLSRRLYDQELQKTNQTKLISDKTGELQDLNHQFNTLKNELSTLGIHTLEDINEKLSVLTDQIKKEDQLHNSAREYRKKIDILRTRIDGAHQELKEEEQQAIAHASTLQAMEDEISDKAFCEKYMDSSTETIQQMIASVRKDIEDTANLLDGKQKVLKEKRQDAATNLANLENFSKSKEEASIKLEKLKNEFDALKTQYGQTDQAQLEKLFNSKLDEDKLDQEIREYEQDCSVVQSHLATLEAEEGIKTFDQNYFDEVAENHAKKKEELEQVQKEKINIDRDVSDIREKLETKKGLLKILDTMENRASNLKELEQLFKGSGFVKYVSSIYLKELCNTANKRFTQLTKNSLRLEIDDNNTFWVIDYLNDGRKRLLKTLSGGQTFQASLCLALALAEKVKSLNQADQSFFFLDEGFGALDRKSLRIVFETLKALRHENRIVGIISHVEELQQEIGVFATIELDPEKGSQVKYSYQ